MDKVIIINSSGYPYGYASVEKIKLIAKGLYENGYQAYILNSFSNLSKSKHPSFKPIGKTDKSIYIYSSGLQYTINKFSKIIRYPLVLIKEIFLLRRILKNVPNRKIVLQYAPFLFVIWYFIVSKIVKADLYINTMEYHISIKKNINSILFDRYSYLFAKGVIVISHFLADIVKENFPNKRTLILPVTVNHSFFSENLIEEKLKKESDYVLFVASAGHKRIFEFIIESFNCLENLEIRLVLIANGSENDIEYINNLIKSQSQNPHKILVHQNLEYKQLIKFYQEALLLLIPLFDDERDIARFPHKIGEYTAAKRPILSTNIGEISYYFKNEHDIFLAENPNYASYGKKMRELVLLDKRTLTDVGKRGYEVGYTHFNYSIQGKKLVEFLNI